MLLALPGAVYALREYGEAYGEVYGEAYGEEDGERSSGLPANWVLAVPPAASYSAERLPALAARVSALNARA